MQPSPTDPFLAAHDQHGYGVRLEWGHTGARLLAADAGVVVVVDVLSFSTAVFRSAGGDLPGTLAGTASGRELVEAGYRRDVELAANLDVTDVVPVLVDGEFRGR